MTRLRKGDDQNKALTDDDVNWHFDGATAVTIVSFADDDDDNDRNHNLYDDHCKG